MNPTLLSWMARGWAVALMCAQASVSAQAAASPAPAAGVDLLQRYPTKLQAGDTAADRARAWQFTPADIFELSGFQLRVGTDLRVESGPADVGIGHCSDGAVWAVLIPRTNAMLTSTAAAQGEALAHIWLRFHPGAVGRLFPPATVRGPGNAKLAPLLQAIEQHKLLGSWHAGDRVTIPDPKDVTVDADTKAGVRRFFGADTEANSAQYYDAFESRPYPAPPAYDAQTAEKAFDELWQAFDRDYAMFALRPEVDWGKLREQYRPKALACESTLELAGVMAELLKPLRDLHVWLTVAGANVPVFNRPRSSNANPSAHRALLGGLKQKGRVAWTVTADKIGYLAIYGWSGAEVPARCREALEAMRGTRGLIVDVRLNGGGGEPLAQQVAGRFLEQEFVYAYSQYRTGPNHADLTEKLPRKVKPVGPWRYQQPVVLLIGEKCMSSNESFVAMMSGATNVVIMGDHTCGSSGNPRMVTLPLEITVSVPRWIDYLPDGSPLDERGFQPQVVFKPEPGAFEGERDDLLSAALERLRPAPLPSTPSSN